MKSVAWLALWILASRLFGKRDQLPADADVVLLSVVNAAAVDANGFYTSSYYGPLVAFLEARGQHVVHCGLVEGLPWTTVRHLANTRSACVVTFGDFVGFGDLFTAAFSAIRSRFVPPAPAIARRMAGEMRHARGDIILGILIERATRRLLQRLPSARVIHTYENNPWEHACDVAAREANRSALGYLHCAVLPSHLKNYIGAGEDELRPAPDRIICTGERSRDVFLSLGEHDPDHVAAACALRDTDITKLPLRDAIQRPIKTVLVLLEGIPSVSAALAPIETAARAMPECKFMLRAHPSLPLSVIAAHAQVHIGPGIGQLDEAPHGSLSDTISQADAVIYIGSTAAISAVYMGVPAIKFVLDDAIEDDPLFAAPVTSPRARSGENIVTALRAIEAMPPEAFRANCAALRSYIHEYLTPPGDETMSVFL